MDDLSVLSNLTHLANVAIMTNIANDSLNLTEQGKERLYCSTVHHRNGRIPPGQRDKWFEIKINQILFFTTRIYILLLSCIEFV